MVTWSVGDGENSVAADGEKNTPQGEYVRVYFDPMGANEPKVGWFAVWTGPGLLLLAGAGALLLAARIMGRDR